MKDFKAYLPSKKFLVSLATVIGIILVIIIVIKIKNRYQNTGPNAVVTVGDVVRRDSNNNGIPDWQETISQLKAGTPGLDGSIANPLGAPTEIPQTYTEQFAQDMFVTLAALSEDNLLDATSADYVSQNMSSFINKLSSSKTWSRQDLHIVNNAQQNVEDYLTTYNLFIQIYNPTMDPITPLQNSMASQDSAPLAELDVIVQHNNDALISLQEVVVPEKFASYHLEIMNSLQGIMDATSGIQQYFTDPLLTFSAILLYNESIVRYFQVIEDMNNDFYQLVEKHE
ncbi:MAG: hypothetical protein KBC22_00530 [Candidatus Pacebacteria bacterium]|nr:hypothetical protein [Candidatus Paceibacterota bacterium]